MRLLEFGGHSQGKEEGVHHLLHYLHSQLHHQALPAVQDSPDWARAGRHCNIASFFGIRVMARRRAQQGSTSPRSVCPSDTCVVRLQLCSENDPSDPP